MKLSVSVSSVLVFAFAFVSVSLAFTIFSNSVFSSTSENNPVLQQAQKSLEENQKKLTTVSPEPVPDVVPSARPMDSRRQYGRWGIFYLGYNFQ